VLGAVADAFVTQAEAPTLVTVSVPRQATELLTRPFELAIVRDKPLAPWDLTLAFEIEGAKAPFRKEGVGAPDAGAVQRADGPNSPRVAARTLRAERAVELRVL
jgi:hypothetical protein